MKRHTLRTLTASILAALVIGGATVPTVLAATSDELQSSINSLESKQDDLQSKQNQISSQLDSLRKNKEKQEELQHALENQMMAIQEEVNVINQKIRKLDKKIAEKKAEIADDEKEITHTFNQLKERIRALYLAGEASTLDILLNSHSIADFADKAEVMRSITSHDTDLINKLKVQLAKVKDQKAEIEKDRQEVSDSKTELESKQKEVQQLSEECKAVVAELSKDEAYAKAQRDKLAQQEAEVKAEQERLHKAYLAALTKEEIERQKKAAEEVKQVTDDDYDPNIDYSTPDNGSSSSGDSGASGGDSSGDSGSSGGGGGGGSGVAQGQFVWPVPSCTTCNSGVGPRWGTSHNGIDIPGGMGSAIVAADGGTVYSSYSGCPHNYGKNGSCGCGGGFGNHVIIDHGNGYFTTYGHMTSVYVSPGQAVSRGQQIGTIGSTGYSTGAHLHFELRMGYYGAVLDPLNYIG